MYIHHSHRVYSLFCIWHVPVLDQTAYGNVYSIIWHHVVLCVDHKMEIMETGLYYKTISHMRLQHQHHSEHDIPFLTTFVCLPVFLFALINHCIFVCHTIQVFLEFSFQTNIGCTDSSVYNYLGFIKKLHLKLVQLILIIRETYLFNPWPQHTNCSD